MGAAAARQVMEKEELQPEESEESSIYSPAIPREKWQRKRTQVKIRVCARWPSGAQPSAQADYGPGVMPGWSHSLVGPVCLLGVSFGSVQAAEPAMSLQNVTANHRASDVIVCEGKAQVLSGRFMYGPLDVVTLTGEKVPWACGGHQDPTEQHRDVERVQDWCHHSRGRDVLNRTLCGTGERVVRTCRLGGAAGSVGSVHAQLFSLSQVDIYIMTQPLSGKWLYYGTEVTSGSGRLTFTIPPDKALAIGIYPVRMVVR